MTSTVANSTNMTAQYEIEVEKRIDLSKLAFGFEYISDSKNTQLWRRQNNL